MCLVGGGGGGGGGHAYVVLHAEPTVIRTRDARAAAATMELAMLE